MGANCAAQRHCFGTPLQSRGLGCRYHKDFVEQEELGRGAFGVVVAAINRIDGRKYAIKKVRTGAAGDTPWDVLSEVSALSVLQHAHIVRYFQAWQELTDAVADGLPAASESSDSATTASACRHTGASGASSDAWPGVEAVAAAPRLPPLAEGSMDEGTSPSATLQTPLGSFDVSAAAGTAHQRPARQASPAAGPEGDDDTVDSVSTSASSETSEAASGRAQSPTQSFGGWGWDWETSAGALQAGGERAPPQLWSSSSALTATTTARGGVASAMRSSFAAQVRHLPRCLMLIKAECCAPTHAAGAAACRNLYTACAHSS